MYAIEFKTKIKDGKIIIPERFRQKLKENVQVIVLTDEKLHNTSDLLTKLMKSPLKISGFKPMTRDEIYDGI